MTVILGTHIPVAFVSTNSISQGEQVGILWGELFNRYHLKIQFAHRTFQWASESRGKAHVHVVIIGFGRKNPERKQLYEYDTDGSVTKIEVANINPYLIPGNDVVVNSRSKPLCQVPEMTNGSKPVEGGNLILTNPERDALVNQERQAARFIRPFIGSDEFLNEGVRWCLWLKDASPNELRAMPFVMDRIERVKASRLAKMPLLKTIRGTIQNQIRVIGIIEVTE